MSIDTAYDAPRYEPKPGSVAQRAIAHLESLEPGASLTSAALAEAIGVDPAVISGSLESPLKAGVVLAHQRGGHPKSPRFWALAQPRTNGRTAGLEPAADGSQKPNGEAMAAVRPAKAGSVEGIVSARQVNCGVASNGSPQTAGADATPKRDHRGPPIRDRSNRGTRTSGARSPENDVTAGETAPPPMRIALWSDGVLQVMRAPGPDGVAELVFFSAEETRQLVQYLDRMAIDEEASA